MARPVSSNLAPAKKEEYMSTMSTADWRGGAKVLRKLRKKLELAGFKGETLEHLQRLLTDVSEDCDKKAASSILEAGQGDVILLDDDEPSNGNRSKAKRAPRPIPAGTFGFRPRVVKYGGKQYKAATIAHGFCLIARDIIKTGGKVDAEGVAAAIQEAYHENNYEPYRVYVDLKKFQKRKFACQGDWERYEEAAEEALSA